MISWSLLHNFYPAISQRGVRKKKKATILLYYGPVTRYGPRNLATSARGEGISRSVDQFRETTNRWLHSSFGKEDQVKDKKRENGTTRAAETWEPLAQRYRHGEMLYCSPLIIRLAQTSPFLSPSSPLPFRASHSPLSCWIYLSREHVPSRKQSAHITKKKKRKNSKLGSGSGSETSAIRTNSPGPKVEILRWRVEGEERWRQAETRLPLSTSITASIVAAYLL